MARGRGRGRPRKITKGQQKTKDVMEEVQETPKKSTKRAKKSKNDYDMQQVQPTPKRPRNMKKKETDNDYQMNLQELEIEQAVKVISQAMELPEQDPDYGDLQIFQEEEVEEILGDIPEYLRGMEMSDFMMGMELPGVMVDTATLDIMGEEETAEVMGGKEAPPVQVMGGKEASAEVMGEYKAPDEEKTMEVPVDPKIVFQPKKKKTQQEMKHKCHFCPRRCAQPAQLIRHETIHFGVRGRPVHICPHCNAPYAYPMTLNYHIRVDHPGLPKYDY